MDGWIDGWMDGCMNGWMDGCVDIWIYGCMDALITCEDFDFEKTATYFKHCVAQSLSSSSSNPTQPVTVSSFSFGANEKMVAIFKS